MTTAALPLGRLAAGVLALASAVPLWFGFWWAALGVTVAQTPNPDIADGDPCCGHPNTWIEVVLGFVGGVMLLAGCAALIYIALRLAHFALLGVRPTAPQTRRVAAAAGYIATTLALLLLVL